jgi:hypothetical protein
MGIDSITAYVKILCGNLMEIMSYVFFAIYFVISNNLIIRSRRFMVNAVINLYQINDDLINLLKKQRTITNTFNNRFLSC